MDLSHEINMSAAVSRPPYTLTGSFRSLGLHAESAPIGESCSSSWNAPLQSADSWKASRLSSEPSFPSARASGFSSSGWDSADYSKRFSSGTESSTHLSGPTSYNSWTSTGPSPVNPRQSYGLHSSSDTPPGLAGSTFAIEADPPGFNVSSKSSSQRAGSNRDEFDGPHQLLDRPAAQVFEPSEEDLISLPTHLEPQEQDYILNQVNTCLSRVAFNFVAMYQFPIPLEPNKRRVRSPADREWNEWVFLLKRLATKRRIPARVLYNGEIRQLNTVLENSLEMRHVAMHRSRPIKDDRNVLQLISAGTQVAKILKDGPAMRLLDALYADTEMLINSRRN